MIETNSRLDTQALLDNPVTVSNQLLIAEIGPAGPFNDSLTAPDIVIIPMATPEERDRLLVLVNDYRDVFNKRLTELGCTNVLTMDTP